jgi:hypothetical protein
MADSPNANLPAVQNQRQRVMVMDAQPLYDSANFEHMARIASMMAGSSLMPEHLRVFRTENGALVTDRTPTDVAVFLDEKATTSNAFLIVNQARLFDGMDPFALAQCSYVTRGRLGYEGKLVQAVLERRIGAMQFEYFGTPGTDGYGVKVTAWVPGSDPARQATIEGTVADWATRKSGGGLNHQWTGKSSQFRMLHYRGTREWARLYAPGLTLGLLDEDDLEAMREDYRVRGSRTVALEAPRPFNPLREDEAALAPPAAAQDVRGDIRGNTDAREEPNDATSQPGAPGADTREPASVQEQEAAQAGPAEAPQGAKRAPRGTPARADRIEMNLSKATTREQATSIWEAEVLPFLDELKGLGVNASAYQEQLHKQWDRLMAAFPQETPAQGAALPAHDPATGEVTPDTRDWPAFVTEFEGNAAVCQSFDSLDLLIEETMNSAVIPADVQEHLDEVVDARRSVLGRGSAPAGASDQAAPDEGQATDQVEASPLTPDEALEVVDNWNQAMRRCRSIEDLEQFNRDTITPFMAGPQRQYLDPEMVEDARTTFENRRRLLARKAAEQN